MLAEWALAMYALVAAPVAQPGATTVPLDFYRGLPLVQISVNHAPPAWFLLDTASSWNFLDAATAESLQLKTEGGQTIRGGGDHAAAITFASGVSLTVGDTTRADDHVAVMRLPFKYDRPIAGMLGAPFLTQFVVSIDYKAGTLTLQPPETRVDAAGASVLPFRLQSGIPTIDARITRPDGLEVTAALHVDTGASQTIILNRPFAIANGFLKDGDEKNAVQAGSLTGGTSYVPRRAASLTLGSIAIIGVVVNVSLDQQGAGAQSDRAGLIGDGILHNYVMTLDYPRARIVLR
jgi:aspartyl protease